MERGLEGITRKSAEQLGRDGIRNRGKNKRRKVDGELEKKLHTVDRDRRLGGSFNKWNGIH